MIRQVALSVFVADNRLWLTYTPDSTVEPNLERSLIKCANRCFFPLQQHSCSKSFRTPQRCVAHAAITGAHSNQDPSYTLKPTYYGIFTELIWSSLPCSPEIRTHGRGRGEVVGVLSRSGGQTTQIICSLSPKRDCSLERVNY